MHYEVRKAIYEFCDSYVWPDEIVSLKTRPKHFVVAKQMDDTDAIDRLVDAINKQKELFPDANYDDILGDLMYADEMLSQQKIQFEQMKTSDKESVTRFGG